MFSTTLASDLVCALDGIPCMCADGIPCMCAGSRRVSTSSRVFFTISGLHSVCLFVCLLVLRENKMRFPFESEEAAKLNRDIFETIYFGAVEASVEVRIY